MSLNCAEIDIVLGELDLEGSFIQNIVQPSYDTIAFYTYKGSHESDAPPVDLPSAGSRKSAGNASAIANTPATANASVIANTPAITNASATENAPAAANAPSVDAQVQDRSGVSRVVLVCLAPGVCRLHETRRKVPRNDKPLRFMEFLRSRVKGSRIQEAVQLNNDRIVRLTLLRSDETLFMYIRLWSGAANIVVTDSEDSILDVFYRRPKRGEITGGTWELPEAKKSDRVFSARELEGESTFSERIDRWYAEHAQALSLEALIEEARRRHDTRCVKLSLALKKLETKRDAFLHADLYRHQGDLLTANLYAIKPGMTSIELVDYENENAIVRIELDPHLKAQENAALFYNQYKKAVSGLAELEDDINATKRTIETLDAELAAIEAEKNPLVIHNTLRKQNKPRQQVEKRYPGLTFRKDGWILLVGRTAAENDELLRRHVKGLDLWLHTRDWPGGYVFIKNRAGKSIPLEILLDAGTLALFYSKGRKAGTADLYYTQVKHLRRAKNAPKGTVLPSNEKNLTVKLDDARLKQLETCRDEE